MKSEDKAYCRCDLRLFKTKTMANEDFDLRLQVALNALSRAFEEIQETKEGILDFVNANREGYCTKIQTFSVLAYDYLEKIDNFTKRETVFEEEVVRMNE